MKPRILSIYCKHCDKDLAGAPIRGACSGCGHEYDKGERYSVSTVDPKMIQARRQARGLSARFFVLSFFTALITLVLYRAWGPSLYFGAVVTLGLIGLALSILFKVKDIGGEE